MSLGEQLGRLLIHEQVSEDEAKMRISICEGCDLFKQDTRQCSICDCYMDSKVKAKRHFELTEFKVVDTHCPKKKCLPLVFRAMCIDDFKNKW